MAQRAIMVALVAAVYLFGCISGAWATTEGLAVPQAGVAAVPHLRGVAARRLPDTPNTGCYDASKLAGLLGSHDMEPVTSSTTVDIPLSELWLFFTQAESWPLWDAAYAKVSTPLVTLCEPLDVQFHLYSSKVPKFIHLPSSLMPYNVTYTSTSVYLAWTYSAPGLFGMHSTAFEAISPTQTRFTGWEQAEGTLVKLASSFWTTQFQYVADETASGISCLERVYQATGHLNNTNVAATCSSTSSSGILAL